MKDMIHIFFWIDIVIIRLLFSSGFSFSMSPGPGSGPERQINLGNIEHYGMHHDDAWYRRNNQMVMLVDDEESIRLAVGDYLFESGFQVTACADADSLLEILNDQTGHLPDIIVSDIRMPGKDGIELTKELKSNARFTQIPIVLLTAKGLSDDKIIGYRSGADAYLSKPFEPEELLAIIDNVVIRNGQMIGGEEREDIAKIRSDISIIKDVIRGNSEKTVKPLEVSITPVESEILNYLGQGLSNSEIAEARGVSKVGVQRVISTLYTKSMTETRTALIRWAIERGF